MNQQNPLMSVIMSVFNTPEKYLRRSIESVLIQTYENFEFIIVDDASDQETKRILAEYLSDKRIILINNNTNLGLTKNLNIALEAAKGKYIARMDSDDICVMNRFEKQITFLENNNNISLIGTLFFIINEDKIEKAKIISRPSKHIKSLLFFENTIMHSSVMMRRSVFNSSNNLSYNIDFKRAQDYDLWERASHSVNILILPEYLMYYQSWESQISKIYRDEQSIFEDKVRTRQFKELFGSYNKNELDIYLSLCSGEKVSSIVDLDRVWKKILFSNKTKKIYDNLSFKYFLIQRASHCAIKSMKNISNIGLVLNVLSKNIIYSILIKIYNWQE